MGRIFFSKVYLIFLPLCIILTCLGRNLFRKLYQYLGGKFFWKLYLILLPLYTLLYYLGRNLFRNLYQYLGRNFFWKLYFILLLSSILLLFICGDIYSLKIVPIHGEIILLKGVLDIFTIVYHTFIFGKKFILKRLPNIWEEISSSSCTRHCYHYVSYVYIWEEIYSKICTNICEENSSESCNWYCYNYASFYIWEQVILKFVPIFGKKFLLKALLDIVTIMYPTLLFGKKFILKIVPMFGEKILLKVVLDIITIEHVEYPNPTFISAKKFILKLLLICWYWMYLYLRTKFSLSSFFKIVLISLKNRAKRQIFHFHMKKKDYGKVPFYFGTRFKEWVSYFLGSWGMIWAQDKQIVWTAKRFSNDLFVPRSDSFPMNPEKRHLLLIFTMLPSKILSKILLKKL